MDFVIPKTKIEAYKTLANRRFYDQPMLKYDMFLLGIVCCGDEEFFLKSARLNDGFINVYPCLCKYLKEDNRCNAGLKSCKIALQETFSMKWDDKLVYKQ